METAIVAATQPHGTQRAPNKSRRGDGTKLPTMGKRKEGRRAVSGPLARHYFRLLVSANLRKSALEFCSPALRRPAQPNNWRKTDVLLIEWALPLFGG